MEGSIAAFSVGEVIHEVFQVHPAEQIRTRDLTFQEYLDRDDNDREGIQKTVKAFMCVDNKAALQILRQEGESWRTRHLRVRAEIGRAHV